MSNPQDQVEESVDENEAGQNKQTQEREEVADPGEDTGGLIAEASEEVTDAAEIAESTEVTVESLQAKLDATDGEITKFRDMALRAEAEMQNVRRRASKDLENAHRFGIEKFVQDILPVVDSLEKAVESVGQVADNDTNKAIVDGIGLCQKMFIDVLGKNGVAAIDPNGEPFDPNLHQAMSMVENPDVEPNSVVAVMQKGYTLKDRLVRPAMVMVSKAAAPTDE